MREIKNTASNRLANAVNQKGTYLFIVLILIALVTDFFSGYFDAVSKTAVLILGAAVIVVTLLQNKRIVDTDNSPLFLVGSYLIIYLLAFMLVLPYDSAYMFIGTAMVAQGSYAWGKTGALATSLLCMGIVELAYITGDTPKTPEEFANLIRLLAIFAIVATYVYNAIYVAKKELETVSSTSEKLRTEHSRMLSLINSMGDGVISTDGDGKIMNYNGAALELLDTNVSINGKELSKLINLKDEEDKAVDIITIAKKAGHNLSRRDLRLYQSKEESINLYVNISPIHLGYGTETDKGFTLIMRDITREKSLEEERDEFISVVSHELRTPITISEGKLSNAILLNDNSIKDKKLGEAIDGAHKQIMFLADMINDLATLARAERSALDMEVNEIDSKQLIHDVITTYEIDAKQKGLTLSGKTPKSLPTLHTSNLYLREILQNFVTNAIKYTKEGGITVTAKASGKNSIVYSVQDTGIGLSKSDKNHIFEKFFRSEDYRTRENSGTGLGLHVTEKIAEKIGAKIEVKSKLNHGSTFSVTVSSVKKRRS